jgi:glutathione synthase/RimK-type ligase-like ATP-grasp enzyme
MTRVAIATCAQLPNLDPDDRLLAQELASLGARVTPAVWNDVAIDWGDVDVCVLRSTWDYHKDPATFLRWVDDASSRTTLVNPPELLRWNSHKFYLKELESVGIAIVPTVWLHRGRTIDLEELLRWLKWPEAVIKPAHGASADGILHVGTQQRVHAQSYLQSLLDRQDVLLQPYLTTISTYPERSLVFIAGRYSHAVTKMPFMHADSDLAQRTRLRPGAAGEMPVEATQDEVSLAARALDASPQGHVYARVDLVLDGASHRVLEVELIEPTLYLHARPSAAQALARAIVEYAASSRKASGA